MTDFYIAFVVLGLTFLGAIVYAIVKGLRSGTGSNVPDAHRVTSYQYNPGTSISEVNSGFSEGIVLGADRSKLVQPV